MYISSSQVTVHDHIRKYRVNVRITAYFLILHTHFLIHVVTHCLMHTTSFVREQIKNNNEMDPFEYIVSMESPRVHIFIEQLKT